ncbi:Ankyrin [Plasmopara halstedii]|uniref:Ankyrin n=1 Tax=Plasmopara halstedii TaxID=4781 RepID=A0A0P1B766_PLAHL|nr:Ankyrin [Plasmopara halstedii]CEG50154.1 Ankyrin [Plasmopara halstedii]|eukprot:XP_024586523.1 Ankyrin [Plasmopara halstedii]
MGGFISKNSVVPQAPLSHPETNASAQSSKNKHKLNTLVPDPQATNSENSTTLEIEASFSHADLGVQFLKAVKRGDVAIMETLLLQYQVQEPSSTEFFENKIEGKGIETLVNIRGMWESTPLISAAQYAHCEAALWLLNHGANPHSSNEKNVTALLLASLEGLTPLVVKLVENIDSKSSTQSIDQQIGAVYNAVFDVNLRLSPLLAASMNGHEDIVRLLLDNGADVNQQVVTTATPSNCSPDGSTALLLASQYGHTNVVNLLLQRNADYTLLDSATGSSAFSLACEYGQEECAMLLLQIMTGKSKSPKTSDMGMESWQAGNHQGFTPLHFAAANGLVGVCTAILSALKAQQSLEDEVLALSFVNARAGPRQESALLLAARKRQNETSRLLLEAGADAELVDRDGNTAMQVFLRNKQDALLQLCGVDSSKSLNEDQNAMALLKCKEEELRGAETHANEDNYMNAKILTDV